MAIVVLAHGGWSAAWAWKKVRPLMAAAGHHFFTPTYTGLGERAHLASPSNDLETHIQDLLGVLRFEDLHEVVLIGHSYGGMVATGVADRERDRVVQLIYLDAFVPTSGQGLIDLVPPAERQRLLDSVKTGDGWRVTPNPTPPDTSPEDFEWISKYRMPQSARCFEQPLRLQAELSLPRAYIHCTRYADKKPFAQFASRANGEAGWQAYELDASHSPNAPTLLMEVLNQILSNKLSTEHVVAPLNTTGFHTSKDEGHLHPKQSAHRASAAAPVAPYRHARLSAMKLAGDLQG